MLARMPAQLLAEWQAFGEVEPWGTLHEDARFAVLGCLIANQWRGKDSPVVKPGDLFPHLAPARPPQSIRSMADYAKRLTLAHGGEILGDNRQS